MRTNSPRSRSWYDEDVGALPALVGDAGIYLMSNGEPPIYHDGTLVKEADDDRKLQLTAEAEGCGAFAEFEFPGGRYTTQSKRETISPYRYLSRMFGWYERRLGRQL